MHQGVLWGYWGEPRARLGVRLPCGAFAVGNTDMASRSLDNFVASQGMVQLPWAWLQRLPRQASWRTLRDAFSSEAVRRTCLYQAASLCKHQLLVLRPGKLLDIARACRYNLLRRAVVELPPQLPTQQHVRCTIKLHDPERYRASSSLKQHWLQVSVISEEKSCVVLCFPEATGALCQISKLKDSLAGQHGVCIAAAWR